MKIPAVPLKDFAEDSDLHGLKQVTRSSNGLARRVIWGIFLFAALSVLIYNTTEQVLKYLAYDHVTKFDITFVHDLDFPSFTVCNVNRYRRSAFTKEDMAIMGPHLGLTDENITLFHQEHYSSTWVDSLWLGTDWEDLKTSLAGQEYDIAEFTNRTGHQFDDLVQHCKWRGDFCNDTSWNTVFTHYGKCYSFNDDGSHKLKKAGSGNGLELYLYVEDDEYIESEDASDLGIKFLAHDIHEPPFLKELGFGLAPGYHYLIALQQRVITGIGMPYTECIAEKDMIHFDEYSVPACRIECETEEIYAQCNCRLVESPGDYPVCTPEQIDCAEDTLLAIEQSDACLCDNPCNVVQYPYKVSLLQIRDATIDKLKAEHPIPAHVTVDNLVVLNVYFDLLAFEEITQVAAYTVLDILGDFGGTMGLYLGASVLAAFQLMDYCLIACTACCCQKKKTSTQVQNMPGDESITIGKDSKPELDDA